MKMKHMKIAILIAFIAIAISCSLFLVFSFNPSFSEKDAFMVVFGNYDSIHKSAAWKNMNFPKSAEVENDFWKSKTGTVSKVFFEPYKENGKKKFFFLTKTSPINTNYDCHACLPLLSATIFSKKKWKWEIESQNLFLMYEGEYAESPIVNLIRVGDEKYGATLECEHRSGESFDKEWYLLIPHDKNIVIAHQETRYYDDFNSCDHVIQCAAYSTTFNFSKVPNDTFYQLTVKKFGTSNDEPPYYKAVPVDEEVTYQILNGEYVKISSK